MDTIHKACWAERLELVVPCARKDVDAQVIDEEAVLYDRATGATHRMNKTALAVWHACDGNATTGQVADRIAWIYDVPPARALEDVEQLIAAFTQAGLVTVGNDG